MLTTDLCTCTRSDIDAYHSNKDSNASTTLVKMPAKRANFKKGKQAHPSIDQYASDSFFKSQSEVVVARVILLPRYDRIRSRLSHNQGQVAAFLHNHDTTHCTDVLGRGSIPTVVGQDLSTSGLECISISLRPFQILVQCQPDAHTSSTLSRSIPTVFNRGADRSKKNTCRIVLTGFG